MITVYYNKNEKLHWNCTNSFIQGLKNYTIPCREIPIEHGYIKSDAVVLFGYKKNNNPGKLRKRIIDDHNNPSSTIIIERGFIRRKDYYSIGIGHFNGRADFKNHNSPRGRWDRLGVVLQPLRGDGEHILLCGQVPWDASVQHIDYHRWVKKTYNILKSNYNSVIFKPHPLQTKAVNIPTTLLSRKLSDILPECRFSVSFNSNSGVESIIEGVPTVSIDSGSMVYNISSHDILNPMMPTAKRRFEWACNIAYAQWTLNEMKEGLPQKHLGLI